MEDLNDKATGGQLLATEWNQIPSELQNAIESAGITLSSGDLEQFAQAVAHYASNSTFYTDSGTGTAYVLTPIGTNFTPPVYVDGMEIEFVIGNTNTAAATVDVDGKGAISIKDTDTVGFLVANTIVRFRYSDSTTQFIRVSTSVSQGNLATGDTIPSSDPTITDRGFLLVDGSEVSRTTFADLFAEIGVSFGPGDGSTTFNIPRIEQLKFPGTSNVGDFEIPVVIDTGKAITNVAVNTATKDVWITDINNDVILKSEGGVEDYVETGDYGSLPGVSNPNGITIDSITGDVYVIDGFSNQVYVSLGGTADFVQFGDYLADVGGSPNPRGLAINEITKDLFVAENGGDFIFKRAKGEGAFFKLHQTSESYVDVAVNFINGDVIAITADTLYRFVNGTSRRVAIAGFTGSDITGVSVNSFTGDIWVSPQNQLFMFKFPGGRLPATSITFDGGIPTGVDVDETNGDIYIANSVASAGEIYRLDGQIDTASIDWYIKT